MTLSLSQKQVKFKFVGAAALSVASQGIKKPPWLPWGARTGGGGGGGGWCVDVGYIAFDLC